MKVPRSTKPNQKRRYFIRMLLAALLTTTMIVTGGFGAFSDNPLTEAFQVVIGESFPAEMVNLFNAYMANLSAPQIPPGPDSASDGESPLDPVGVILSFFDTVSISTANEPSFIDATITALAQTQTQVAVIQSRTVTITQVREYKTVWIASRHRSAGLEEGKKLMTAKPIARENWHVQRTERDADTKGAANKLRNCRM